VPHIAARTKKNKKTRNTGGRKETLEKGGRKKGQEDKGTEKKRKKETKREKKRERKGKKTYSCLLAKTHRAASTTECVLLL